MGRNCPMNWIVGGWGGADIILKLKGLGGGGCSGERLISYYPSPTMRIRTVYYTV